MTESRSEHLGHTVTLRSSGCETKQPVPQFGRQTAPKRKYVEKLCSDILVHRKFTEELYLEFNCEKSLDPQDLSNPPPPPKCNVRTFPARITARINHQIRRASDNFLSPSGARDQTPLYTPLRILSWVKFTGCKTLSIKGVSKHCISRSVDAGGVTVHTLFAKYRLLPDQVEPSIFLVFVSEDL
jgi:hypothetical protein